MKNLSLFHFFSFLILLFVSCDNSKNELSKDKLFKSQTESIHQELIIQYGHLHNEMLDQVKIDG